MEANMSIKPMIPKATNNTTKICPCVRVQVEWGFGGSSYMWGGGTDGVVLGTNPGSIVYIHMCVCVCVHNVLPHSMFIT